MKRTLLLLFLAAAAFVVGGSGAVHDSRAGVILGSGTASEPYMVMGQTASGNATLPQWVGVGGGQNSTDRQQVFSVVPNSGTITDLYIGVAAGPGSGGDTITYTLLHCPAESAGVPDVDDCVDADTNWDTTSLTCTLTDAERYCSYSGGLLFVARGDLLVIQAVGGGPSPTGNNTMSGLRIVPSTENTTMVVGTAYGNNTNTRHNPFQFGYSSGNSNASLGLLVPTGVIKDCIFVSAVGHAAGASRYFTLERTAAGTDTAQTVTLDENNRYAEDLSNPITVSSVEHYNWETNDTGTAATQTYGWGCSYVPDEAGVSWAGGAGVGPASAANRWIAMTGGSGMQHSSVYDTPIPVSITVVDAWAYIDTDPTVGGDVLLAFEDDGTAVGQITLSSGEHGAVEALTSIDTVVAANSVIQIEYDETSSPTRPTRTLYSFTYTVN